MLQLWWTGICKKTVVHKNLIAYVYLNNFLNNTTVAHRIRTSWLYVIIIVAELQFFSHGLITHPHWFVFVILLTGWMLYLTNSTSVVLKCSRKGWFTGVKSDWIRGQSRKGSGWGEDCKEWEGLQMHYASARHKTASHVHLGLLPDEWKRVYMCPECRQ